MRYLIWDFDGTLAYRPGMWSQCLADLASQATDSTEIKREHFVPHLGAGFPWHAPQTEHPELSDPDAWWANLDHVFSRAFISGARVEPGLARALTRQVRAKYLSPEEWVVYPDVQPALSALTDKGWRHIILSNHVPELPELVADLGLAAHFQRILSSATLGYEKPHPMAFKAAITAAQCASHMVMIGDSFVADYQGAIAAGLSAVLVRAEHPECQHSSPNLCALVSHINDA